MKCLVRPVYARNKMTLIYKCVVLVGSVGPGINYKHRHVFEYSACAAHRHDDMYV